jgi:hypothetical protein
VAKSGSGKPSPKHKKSYDEIAAELKFIKGNRRSESIATVTQNICKWGGLSFIAYCASSATIALAGQTTVANIGVQILGNMRVSVGLAWTCGIVGVIYGLRQRKLRKDVIERYAGLKADHEKEIDPRRSSSRLTARGDTPAEAI